MPDSPELSDETWVTSSYSADAQCVRVRRVGDDIQIGDSKNPDGAVLHFNDGEFKAFIQGAKALEFDGLYG